MFYSAASPPYVLMVAGLIAGITSAYAFQATLKELVAVWSRSRSTRALQSLRGAPLLVPVVGVSGGVCVFLASSLQLFAFPALPSYAIAFPLTVGSAGLVWYQLGRLLNQLERRTGKALDFDALT
ncbi:MAG: hypothetical protein WBA43_07190 [Elainellaceae cyanobacterium]|uniref:hypothetical protein n=1 Tax=Leptolyngbya sp. CCY15150 TaxID=2767772 RepID=UPI002FE8F4DA